MDKMPVYSLMAAPTFAEKKTSFSQNIRHFFLIIRLDFSWHLLGILSFLGFLLQIVVEKERSSV